MKWLGCLGALVVLALIVGGTAVGTYNSLVGLSQGVDAQWAQVENQYQRRADLIPNLHRRFAVKDALSQVALIVLGVAVVVLAGQGHGH